MTEKPITKPAPPAELDNFLVPVVLRRRLRPQQDFAATSRLTAKSWIAFTAA
jgi:hypothetical protein